MQVMRALGQDPTEDELEAMVEDVDEDGSGTIEVDEFIKMMAKRSKGKPFIYRLCFSHLASQKYVHRDKY